MPPRRARLEEFIEQRGGATTSLSASLVTCAAQLLNMALQERRREVFRTRDNHYTNHAVGSVLVLTAALEAWLNEAIYHGSAWGDPRTLRELAGDSILHKYRGIPRHLGGERLPPDPQMALLLDVRDEIAHFLPRGAMPASFRALQRKGLLITTGRPDIDFFFTQKLPSYRLAYWAWTVVDAAVDRLIGALRANQQVAQAIEIFASTASNFRLYRRVCAPEALRQFDEHYRLELTRVNRG